MLVRPRRTYVVRRRGWEVVMAADDVGSAIEEAVQRAFRERGRVNVLIVGRSGVGKSTLINAVFDGNLAETGQGRPVSTGTREITKEGLPLTILDTRGLEMAAFAETIEELEKLVVARARETDANLHIHVAWICIHEDGRRVEEAETKLHEMLAKYLPVVAVITKARLDAGFRNTVQQLLPHARNVLRVRALPETLDDGHTLEASGLEALVKFTAELVPEGQRRAFAAAQKASLDLKVAASRKVILGSVAAACAAAASPIPFSDAFVLVPIQVGMLAGVSASFGLDVSRAFLTTLVGTVVGAGGAALAGRLAVGAILKLLPGLGSLAGGVIAAATAGTLTTALGEAYLATLVQLFGEAEPITAERVAAELKRRLVLR